LQTLACCLPPATRHAVKAFLDGWYKQLDDCYWHGTHKDKPGHSYYFGYWAFEAALVTYLWNIDDTLYRDHLHYPKDLVDFARNLDAAPKPQPLKSHSRVEANQPCPPATGTRRQKSILGASSSYTRSCRIFPALPTDSRSGIGTLSNE